MAEVFNRHYILGGLMFVLLTALLVMSLFGFDPGEFYNRINDAEQQLAISEKAQIDGEASCFKPLSRQFQKVAYRNPEGGLGSGYICVP